MVHCSARTGVVGDAANAVVVTDVVAVAAELVLEVVVADADVVAVVCADASAIGSGIVPGGRRQTG